MKLHTKHNHLIQIHCKAFSERLELSIAHSRDKSYKVLLDQSRMLSVLLCTTYYINPISHN